MQVEAIEVRAVHEESTVIEQIPQQKHQRRIRIVPLVSALNALVLACPKAPI